MKEELRVRYTVEQCVDSVFDIALIAFAKEHGWYFYGSGFNYTTGVRNLVFDREEIVNAPKQDNTDTST